MKLMGSDSKGGTDDVWWWHYQPIDFKLGNYQFFTNPDNEQACVKEYADMCKAAEACGIKIITDVVTNHTAKDYTQVSDSLLAAVGLKSRPTEQTFDNWKILYHDDWNTLQNNDHSTIAFQKNN